MRSGHKLEKIFPNTSNIPTFPQERVASRPITCSGNHKKYMISSYFSFKMIRFVGVARL